MYERYCVGDEHVGVFSNHINTGWDLKGEHRTECLSRKFLEGCMFGKVGLREVGDISRKGIVEC